MKFWHLLVQVNFNCNLYYEIFFKKRWWFVVGNAEVVSAMQKVQPSLTDEEAEVAVLFLEFLAPKVDGKVVLAAAEAAKSGQVISFQIWSSKA